MAKQATSKKPARAVKPALAAVRPVRTPEDIVEIIDDIEQGTDEWRLARLGLPTASNFAAIMATPRDEDGGMRRKLMCLMAAEILSGQPMATFSNHAMARGKEIEPKAVEYYSFSRNVEVRRVGFVRRTIAQEFAADLVVGASPDGLIGDEGVLEIKRMQADLVVDMRSTSSTTPPGKHKAQIQGNLWVNGRAWCDLLIYPDPPLSIAPPVFRFFRDLEYIERLKNEVDRFVYELRKMVDDLRRMG